MKAEQAHGKTSDRTQHKSVFPPWLVLVPLVISFVLLLVFFVHQHSSSPLSDSSPSSSRSLQPSWHRHPASAGAKSPPMAVRPVYPYSVIPGGVESAKELASSLQHDPVAAQHYSDFHSKSARVIRLVKERHVYVSYRLAGNIYWTRKKLTLRAGETLFSDGSHLARTRCGNRVSEIPEKPVSPSEPEEKTLNNPMSPAGPGTVTESALPSPIWSVISDPSLPVLNYPDQPGPGGSNPGPPAVPIFPCCGSSPNPHPSPPNPSPRPPSPPVVTPEPSSLLLLFLGFGVLLALAILRQP